MKAGIFTTKRPAMRLLAIAVICTFLPNGAAWGKGGVAGVVLTPPLSQITVPVPRTNIELAQPQFAGPNGLAAFIIDVPAAVRLGKAFFWDMQVGSDGQTACATCHFNAGADNRLRNQLNPGARGGDTLFGNSATVLNTFVQGAPLDPLTGLPVPLALPASTAPFALFAPDYTLQPADFPFFRVGPVNARLVIDPVTGLTSDAVGTLSDTNDVAGSQGISRADFLNIIAGSPTDNGTPVVDPVFQSFRRVTARNTPSAINAVFNYANFWDGRANNIFNGASPFGPLDQGAVIYVEAGGALVPQKVAIPNSSLASQATGPPLDDTEMSFHGRTFPELGRKMLGLPRPLNLQLVHPNDSVFSAPIQLSRANLAGGVVSGNPGLNTSYVQMIHDAFAPSLWNSAAKVSLTTVGGPVQFSQIEANFSLFWGLAIQLYEATLVSDKTPFDLLQAGNQNAMSFDAQNGLATFISKCAACHSGSEFTAAVVGSSFAGCIFPDCNPVAFTSNTAHNLIQQNANPTTLAQGLVDTGFLNIGVRPTSDDPGRGGTAPSGLPLSFTRLAQTAGLPFVTPLLPPFLTPGDMVQGTFKVPGLRNAELTPPYFHNGGALTLEQVVEFYTRGGNFPNNPELAGAMQPIGALRASPLKQAELVAFLKALTDERVRNQTAPFDHPELRVPNGRNGNPETLAPTGGAPAPVAPGLVLNPVTTPTTLTTLAIGGTIADAVKKTATVAVSVNGGAAAAATVNCVPDPLGLTCAQTNTWDFTIPALNVGSNTITVTAIDVTGGVPETQSATITVLPTATISGTPQIVTKQTEATLTVGGNGLVSYQFKVDGGAFSADIPVAVPIVLTALADGTHTVAVIGKDGAGNQQPVANATMATWTVKANPLVLTLNPVTTPARGPGLKIDGTVELGVIPVVRADTSVIVGPVVTSGGNWSCQIDGLKSGTTNITVTATDIVLNVVTKTARVKIILPDGNMKGTGNVDISDAVRAIRVAVGLATPSAEEKLHGDVAPLVNNAPAPDDRIDVADALVILRKVAGLINF
jgi:cytochrome c peroxidase